MGSYDEDGVTKTKALEKHQTDIDVNGNPLCLSVKNKIFYF